MTTEILRVPLLIRWSICFVLISVIFFQRFGLNLDFYAVDLSLFAQYILLIALIITGQARPSKHRIALFYIVTASVIITILSNLQQTSFTSVFLLFVIYIPYLFVIAPTRPNYLLWLWTLKLYSNLLLCAAIAGIVQFFAQFFIHEAWLFDFRGYVPSAISTEGVYNTVIPVNSYFKSNGFFFREPSGFSQCLAIAIICEFTIFKRYIRIIVFGFAILLTYSGTGLLVILISFMFPLKLKTVIRFAGILLAALPIFSILGNVLDLSFTVERLDEFNNENSSAFARFESPFYLIQLAFRDNFWSPFIGSGPGTLDRLTKLLGDDTHPLFNPTWAKLIFEYGFFGFVFFIVFFASTMRSLSTAPELRAGLIASWLFMGGLLLAPEWTTMIYVMAGMWESSFKTLSTKHCSIRNDMLHPIIDPELNPKT